MLLGVTRQTYYKVTCYASHALSYLGSKALWGRCSSHVYLRLRANRHLAQGHSAHGRAEISTFDSQDMLLAARQPVPSSNQVSSAQLPTKPSCPQWVSFFPSTYPSSTWGQQLGVYCLMPSCQEDKVLGKSVGVSEGFLALQFHLEKQCRAQCWFIGNKVKSGVKLLEFLVP